jgi:hypothetical protein
MGVTSVTGLGTIRPAAALQGYAALMGVIRTIFGSLEPEYRVEFARAVLPQRTPGHAGALQPHGGRMLPSSRRVATRTLEELIGMCRSVLADDTVDEAEAQFLLDWIETNLHAKDAWPGNILFERLSRAMNDRLLDPHEETELLDILRKVSARSLQSPKSAAGSAIRFDHPVPMIVYPSRQFIVTGQFLYGSRKRVEAAIAARGGTCSSAVPRNDGYLIVGTFGTEEWRADDFGTKIADVLASRDAGQPIAVVAERDWAEQLA